MAYQMAFYAASSIDKINAAISSGQVSYPAYVFIRSENETIGQLGFVDKDNTLRLIKGENKQQVVNVNELPDVSDGDQEVLYICNGIVYSFDGKQFIPSYKDNTAEIEALTKKVGTIETKSSELEGKIETLEKTVENIETSSGLKFVELE